MMAKQIKVERPLRKNEYRIVFISTQAQKGWRDLVATMRNSMVDAWEFLTKTPEIQTPTNYPLRAELSTLTYQGKTFERWQYKPTLKGGARIWYFIDGDTVYLEQVHTAHPNQTK